LKKIVREDVYQVLTKITVPTILFWGRHDVVTPLHQGEKYHKAIPNSKLHIFEKSGHFPFDNEPHKFAQKVIEMVS